MRKAKHVLPVSIAIVVVIVSLSTNFFMATQLFNNASEFGEMFGAATVLFTGMRLRALYIR